MRTLEGTYQVNKEENRDEEQQGLHPKFENKYKAYPDETVRSSHVMQIQYVIKAISHEQSLYEGEIFRNREIEMESE